MDIGEKLEELLGSPDGIAKLQGAAGQLQQMLGEDGDTAALLSSLLNNKQAPPETAKESPAPSVPDFSLLSKAAPFLQAMQQDDDSVRLLRALRPYLHGERQKRLDEATEILKWLRLATMLKEQGVL